MQVSLSRSGFHNGQRLANGRIWRLERFERAVIAKVMPVQELGLGGPTVLDEREVSAEVDQSDTGVFFAL